MNIIQTVEAYQLELHPDRDSGILFVPWQLATLPETPHWHHQLEICFCLSGRGLYYFSDREYEITPGDIIVVNHLERHTARSFHGDICSVLILFFNVPTLEQLDHNLLRPFIYNRRTFNNKIPAQTPAAGLIGELVLRIQSEFSTRQTAHSQVVKALLHMICSLLLRHYGTQNDTEWRNSYSKYTTLEAGLSFIHSHYDEDLTLDHVSRAMSLSSSRARHLFVELIGEGFQMYLIQYRIQQVQRLLSEREKSIESIYLQCGFKSSTSFYRNFFRIVGMSPLTYRKLCK